MLIRKKMIEKLREEDIEQVAEIHMQTMPGGIIGALGYEFLKNVYYKEYINSEYAFAYVYLEGGEVLGVTAGCYNSNIFLKELIKRNKFKLIYFIFRGIIKDRQVLRFVLERIGKKGVNIDSTLDEKKKKQIKDIKAEIKIVAIKPGRQQKGIGKLLYWTSLRDLKKNGINEGKGVVNTHDKKLVSFHRQFASEISHTFKSHGKEWCLIIYRNIQSMDLDKICNDLLQQISN